MAGIFSGWLLVSDFDETMRPEGAQGPISPEDHRALERFMAGGGRFTVATGRDLCSYLSIRDCFPHNAPAILGNGALIAERDGSILWEAPLPENAGAALSAMLRRFPRAGAELHRGAEAAVVRRTEAVDWHLGRMGQELRESAPEEVPGPWNKIVLLFPGPLTGRNESAHEAACWINEHCTALSAVPSGSLVDVVRAGCDKGAAARRLCRMLGVDPSRLAAVGDSWNDLPLLRAAGFAFAPEGAAAEVRREPGVRSLGECGLCLRDAVAALEKAGQDDGPGAL